MSAEKTNIMKKITIFAFIGLIFIGGVVFIPQAKAETVAPGSEISPAEAKILKQALDVLGLVLKDVEAKIAKNEFSREKKVVISKSLSSLGSSLVAVNVSMGGSGFAGNYPGTGSLYSQGADNVSVSEETLGVTDQNEKKDEDKKSGLASLWAILWPRKFFGIILGLVFLFVVAISFKGKEQPAI